MKWLKERDELIAQTEAFVKSVTARRPEAIASINTASINTASINTAAISTARSGSIENPFAPIVARPVAPAAAPNPPAKPLPIENAAPAQPVVQPEQAQLEPTRLEQAQLERSQPERSEASPRAELPPIVAFAQGDVRKEIETRVAAFRANQHRFQREREAYYNAVLTKARSSADRIPDGSST